jgi:hypothetical protein
MATYKVLVIDGPARGRLYEVSSHRFLVSTDMPIEMLGDIQQVSYNVHKFIMCGRMIRIASIQALSENISDVDAFEAIASPSAKDAAI